MITIFLDLKNVFGSVPHQLLFDMLRAVNIPSTVLELFVIVATKNWETALIPFYRGVFQGETKSPIMFLLAFNSLLQLAAELNHACHIAEF